MPSIFTRVMSGELPGRIVYSDDTCAAFLTIAPVQPGHLLVVPRLEVDKWTDLPAEVLAHVTAVSQRIAVALQEVTGCERVGLLIAGFEVAHTHLHLIPTQSMADFDLSRASTDTDPAEQDDIAGKIRLALAA